MNDTDVFVGSRGVKNETVRFQGHSLSYEPPGRYCETGDEGVLEAEENAFHDAALHDRRRPNGVLHV